MGVNQFHLYKKERGLNYNYMDRVVKNYMEMGGVLVHIYPLLGVIKSDGSLVEVGSTEETLVSDVVLNENSSRKYSHVTFDSYMTTKMNTPNFSWSFSGLSLLDGDEKQWWIHYNTMIETLGRKLIVGDVLEFSFMRDIDILGSEKAANKFYVVTSSEREESSWGPEYGFHVWTIKCKPITDSPEYADLFNDPDDQDLDDPFYEDPGSSNGGGGIPDGDDTVSQSDNLLNENDEILKEAEENGPAYRLHDEHHIYLDKDKVLYVGNKPNITGIDGIPAELTCEEIPFGTEFPKNPEDNSYFLRTDYTPPILYKRAVINNHKAWVIWERDDREKWTGVPAILRNAINNIYTFENQSGETLTHRQNMKDLVKARVRKEYNNPRPWNADIANQIDSDNIIGIKK